MNGAVSRVFLACVILLLAAAVPVAAVGNDTISTINPAKGYTDGKTITVTITGLNFAATAGDIRLEMAGEDDIEVTVSS